MGLALVPPRPRPEAQRGHDWLKLQQGLASGSVDGGLWAAMGQVDKGRGDHPVSRHLTSPTSSLRRGLERLPLPAALCRAFLLQLRWASSGQLTVMAQLKEVHFNATRRAPPWHPSQPLQDMAQPLLWPANQALTRGQLRSQRQSGVGVPSGPRGCAFTFHS